MTKPVGSLFDHYRAHHELDRPLLQWIGVVGCIAFPILYLLRRAAADPGPDDLLLRLPAVLLCLGLALRRWWPKALEPHYIAYSWWVVFYCLSFMMSYSMLRNHGGTPFVVNMVMGAVLVVLLADWRNTVAILLLGYVLALALHFLLAPDPSVPRDFVFAAGGSALLVAGGSLSHKGQKRVELERMRRVYIGLAGAVAHEMRTPLAQIRHVLTNIGNGLSAAQARQSPALSAAQLEQLLANVQHGHEAIARGLQAIEITLKQLNPDAPQPNRLRSLSAGEAVQRAVDGFAYDAAEHRERVLVEVRQDFQLLADPTALELVFFNLLKNALYYAPLHPQMTVRFTVTDTPQPQILVRDTGPGMAPEVMAHLFEEFRTSGKAEGTGLGLSFCRRVMRNLGGDIECRSELGRFTEFSLRFPAAPANAVLPATAPAGVALAGRHVLVVDDQPLNRAVARAIVGELGMVVAEAEHGQQALDMLQAGPLPDAVLMDVNMPGLDGIATTRLVRALPGEAARVPVLAITANDSAEVQAEARVAGMQGVLGKPIDPAALRQALGAALEPERPAPAPDPATGAAPASTPVAATTTAPGAAVREPLPVAPVSAAPVAAAIPAPAAAAPSALVPGDVELLNTARIESFRRLGLLDDLMPRALLDLRRHVGLIEQSLAGGERQTGLASLHALVGLAGEIGAQALHQRARERYAAWREGTVEPEPRWGSELRDLLAASEVALERHCGVRAADVGEPH